MKIFVQNLDFIGHHGVFEEERTEGRRFEIDLRVEVPDPTPDAADALETTIDYRELAAIVTEFGIHESFQLVETLGDRIMTTVLDRFPPVRHVDLTIRKYATGVPGDPDWVGITLSKPREEG